MSCVRQQGPVEAKRQENAGVDFFQMPEDVESEQMAAMQAQ